MRLLLLLVAAAAVSACDATPTDLREWTPDDHDRPADQPNGPARPPQPKPNAGGPEELVELAWARQCATCHGRAGHGDGPQGQMLHASDLTRPDWQAKVTDADIATTIRKGKDKMPSFDLPPRVIDGLVKRIRAMKGG